MSASEVHKLFGKLFEKKKIKEENAEKKLITGS